MVLWLAVDVPVQPGAELPDAVADSKPPSTINSVPPPPPEDVIVKGTASVCVTPPPVALTVMVKEPAAAAEVVLTFRLDEPDPPGMVDEEKLVVTPAGAPLAESVRVELKPLLGVANTVVAPLPPAAMLSEAGELE